MSLKQTRICIRYRHGLNIYRCAGKRPFMCGAPQYQATCVSKTTNRVLWCLLSLSKSIYKSPFNTQTVPTQPSARLKARARISKSNIYRVLFEWNKSTCVYCEIECRPMRVFIQSQKKRPHKKLEPSKHICRMRSIEIGVAIIAWWSYPLITHISHLEKLCLFAYMDEIP